jgi:hypothetical protein
MYSKKTAKLTSRSKELIEKRNAKYSEEISIFFQEQTEVLDAISIYCIKFFRFASPDQMPL